MHARAPVICAGRVPPHRSLLVRLLATSMLIALCAIAATAWLAVQITTRSVTREQGRTLSADTDIYDAFIEYGATHEGWEGVRSTVRRLADLTGRRIVLATTDRAVIADSSAASTSTTAAPAETVPDGIVPTATVDPLNLDAALARNTGGRIDPRAVGPYRLTQQERRGLRKLADDQVACLSDGGITAEVVETPSGRPTVRLVDGALQGWTGARCDTGQLHRPVRSERQPLARLTALLQGCVDVAGEGWNVTPMFALQHRRPVDQEIMDSARSCLEDSRRTQLEPYVAPPALLFVTGPATTTPSTVNLSPGNTLRIAGMTAIVLAVAFAAAVLVGVRLVRPLRTLTEAALQPADHPQPVPVTTQDEIGYLTLAFNDLSARRLALEQQRKAMVNDIAHELRTPLTNIRTWLEAARDGIVDIDTQTLDLLVEESVLLHHVVDDLRDIAAADAGNLRLYPEATFVNEVLGQVIAAHQGAADAAGVTLTLAAEADPEADVDPVRLRQLVGNLISNAVRHTPAGGAVTLRIRSSGDRLLIEVADTGTGIAAADLPKVFDRFWRADSSRSRSTGGSGLGLSIARQLARAHGGDITVTSRPGHGSAFTVDLPA